MALPQGDKMQVNLWVLEDLRRLFDHISQNYHSLKNRVLALIAGLVAILTFIFSGDQKWLVPNNLTVAEAIFLGIGAFLTLVSFGLLFWIVATADWVIPLNVQDSRDIYSRFDSRLKYLEFVKKDYEDCIEYGLKKIAIRAKVYNKTLFILSSGIIILLVLKFTS